MYAPQAIFTPERSTQPGVEQFGQGLQSFGGDFGRLAKQQKAAKALYDAVTPAAGDDDSQQPNPIMPKAKFDLLGAQDQIAAVGGYVKKTALQSAMQEQKLNQMRIQQAVSDQSAEAQVPAFIKQFSATPPSQDQMSAIINGAGPQSVSAAAAPTTMENIMGVPPLAPGAAAQPPPLTYEQRLAQVTPEALGALKAPRTSLARDVLQDAMREDIARKNGKGALSVNFSQDPVTGQRYATYGNEMQPSGIDPATQQNSGTSTPVMDESGKVIGHNVPKGGKGGGFTFVKSDELTSDQKQKTVLDYQKAMDGLNQQMMTAQTLGATNQMKYLDQKMNVYQKSIDQINNPTKLAPPGSSPSSVRMNVWDKNGKKFTLPASQQDDAVKQGYLLTAPQ